VLDRSPQACGAASNRGRAPSDRLSGEFRNGGHQQYIDTGGLQFGDLRIDGCVGYLVSDRLDYTLVPILTQDVLHAQRVILTEIIVIPATQGAIYSPQPRI
jgi:hypothetical protein